MTAVAFAYLEAQQRRQTLPFLASMRDGTDQECSRHDVSVAGGIN